MDVNGVWASLNFPSQISGFCGRVFFGAQDQALGAACVRAWNDWLYDEWASVHPERIIPLGIACLSDPVEAATEIRRNAARGFKAVALPERPHAVGVHPLRDVRERRLCDPQQPLACGKALREHIPEQADVRAPERFDGVFVGGFEATEGAELRGGAEARAVTLLELRARQRRDARALRLSPGRSRALPQMTRVSGSSTGSPVLVAVLMRRFAASLSNGLT